MTNMAYYDMDRATLVRVSNSLNGWSAELRPGQQSVAWNPAQKQDLYFLADQIQSLISVVNHLNEIVQNEGA